MELSFRVIIFGPFLYKTHIKLCFLITFHGEWHTMLYCWFDQLVALDKPVELHLQHQYMSRCILPPQTGAKSLYCWFFFTVIDYVLWKGGCYFGYWVWLHLLLHCLMIVTAHQLLCPFPISNLIASVNCWLCNYMLQVWVSFASFVSIPCTHWNGVFAFSYRISSWWCNWSTFWQMAVINYWT